MSVKNGARFRLPQNARGIIDWVSRANKRAPNHYLISQANFLPQNSGVA